MHPSLIANIEVPWIVAAFSLSAISMFAASRLQGAVLRAAGYSIPQSSLLAITYASNAVSVTMPLAGSTVGTGFTYRQLRREGVDAATAGWTLLVSGIVSMSALAFLFAGGLGVEPDGNRVLLACLTTLAGVAPLVLLLVASRSAAVARRADRVLTSMRSGWARIRRSDRATQVPAVYAIQQFRCIRLGRRPAAAALGWATLNWGTDAVCLALCVLASRGSVDWRSLVAIYGVGQAAAGLSFIPAGIGIVEGAIAVALVSTGTAVGVAIPAAVTYRAISCWLPIAVGWILHTRLRGRAPRQAYRRTSSSMYGFSSSCAWPHHEPWPIPSMRWNSAVGIRPASSSPSCGGAWMSSLNETTCTGTRT
jgi:putative heme transporter